MTPCPLHPGVVLNTYYLAEMDLSEAALAGLLDCTESLVNEIIQGKRGISPEIALKLEQVLGTSAAMWVRMQAEWDEFNGNQSEI